MPKRTIEKERFAALDSAGQLVTVVVTTTVIDTGSLDGPREMGGLLTATLTDGRPVNVLPDGSLQVAPTRETLRRV